METRRNFAEFILLTLLLAAPLGLAACSGGGGDDGSGCKVAAGECPNACTSGVGVEGESCGGPDDCSCGLFCKSGSCAPYEGENAGCACKGGDEPDAAGDASDASGGPDINDCAKKAPEQAECNPYCQIGCAGDEHCAWNSWNFMCMRSGDAALGEACGGSQACSAGLSCFMLQGEAGNTCRMPCINDEGCPGDRKCNVTVNFGSGVSASFCSAEVVGCDVFADAPGACAEGEACYFGNQVTSCMAAGNLTEGEVCQALGPNSCAPGLQCLVECTQICSISGDAAQQPKCADACAAGQLEINAENGIGVCLDDTPPAACDLFEQTGCAPGDGCYMVLGGWGCASAGSVPAGDACQFNNDCVPGTLCVNDTCAPPCSVAEDAPEERRCTAICDAHNQLMPVEWNLGVCTDAEPAVPCNFWAQDCEEGKSCYFLMNGATCLDSTGTIAAGQPCEYATDCAEGLICANDSCLEPCSLDEFAEPPAPICQDVCPGGFTAISLENQIGSCE